jgi:hypothetical protein
MDREDQEMEGCTAVMNIEPVFLTIGEALSIGFRKAEEKAPIKGSTDSALRHLKEERYGLPASAAARRVNKMGLNDQEFRAQCVMVVETVRRRLNLHECATVTARFTTIAVTRAAAVREIKQAYGSLCSTSNSEALLALIWGIYVPGIVPFPNETPQSYNERRKRREKEWSVRSIGQQCGLSKSTLHRDQIMLRKLLSEVELNAQNKLEVHFVQAGLLRAPEDD